MNQRIKDRVMPDQLGSFLEFTNITTVRDRLKGKKIISADFIDVITGWFRAQYITVEAASDGRPNVVIYTTRNVDDEKRREEYLVRLSMTDELTRLYNRRRLEEDMAELRAGKLDDNLAVFCIDVNGLKVVNDTKGHAAGDELIKGAADCLVLSIGQAGKVYRTGGDEFMAIVRTEAPESLRENIRSKMNEWHGMRSDKLALAIGFATSAAHPDATVDDLEHLADADMYAASQRAEAIRKVGEAEAAAIEAKALAEAQGIDAKAEAMKKYGEAAVIEIIMRALPEIAGSLAAPLENVDSITMYGTGNNTQFMEDLVGSLSQVTNGVTSGLGIDLRAILAGALGGTLAAQRTQTEEAQD